MNKSREAQEALQSLDYEWSVTAGQMQQTIDELRAENQKLLDELEEVRTALISSLNMDITNERKEIADLREQLGEQQSEIEMLKHENEQLHKKKNGIVCPFCNEDNFDELGLKIHLFEYCDKYKSITAPSEEY